MYIIWLKLIMNKDIPVKSKMEMCKAYLNQTTYVTKTWMHTGKDLKWLQASKMKNLMWNTTKKKRKEETSVYKYRVESKVI